MTQRFELPAQRLEQQFGDKSPLYGRGEAVAEANRCIYCAEAPCQIACPTDIDVPGFIRKISTDNVKGAARTILSANLLGYSCARVCPVEELCAGACVYNHWGRRPIEIGRLQRYATEVALTKDPALVAKTRAPASGKTVALLGAGPASLAAAGHLALAGHRAVLFEKSSLPGGLNTFAIAPYKLQADDALAEIEFLLGLGDIDLRVGVEVVAGEASADHQVSARSLLADYDALFVGMGLGEDNRLGIPGEDGAGVFVANELIAEIKTGQDASFVGAKAAVVVGGGNTAIDCARELAGLGVETTMVYRRGESAMTGYVHEKEAARQAGVRLLFDRQPIEIAREGELISGVKLAVTTDDRTTGVEMIACDLVVYAIGRAKLTSLAEALEVAVDDQGRVVVDEKTCRTSNPRVYAGGDCVNGGKEVVNAAQHGKIAALAISKMFQTNDDRGKRGANGG